jgi:hypothetical protein
MKRYQSMLAVAFLLWGISLAHDLYAATVILNPTEDTWIYQYAPDTNYGSSEGIASDIQYMSPRGYALLKFDVSSLSGKTIQGAVLHLYQYNGGGYGNGPTALLYNSNNSWAGGTVTWNNFVAGTQTFLVQNSDGGSYRGPSAWAFSWNPGWGNIISLMIGENSSGDQSHNWYAKEYTGTEGFVPYLEVTISEKIGIGVFRPSTGMWYLDVTANNVWDGCGNDGCYFFGTTGDIPIAGDWNNDGVTEIGVFRPSTGMWYLDQNGNDAWSGCGTDSCIHFGMSGDLPVAGDWNNGGPGKVGVFRPSTGMWYLDYNSNGQWDGCGTDSCIHFGMSGDLPVAGDWNGDGKSKVGVFRPSTGMWYLDFNGNGQWDGCGTDKCINFGVSGDQPVAGDWNGSGTAKVGVFRTRTGMWYVDLNGNGAWDGCSVDRCYNFGTAGDIAVTGSW